MTIEIKELVIKANISKTPENTTGEVLNQTSMDQQKIIQACVEQVLEILKREKER